MRRSGSVLLLLATLSGCTAVAKRGEDFTTTAGDVTTSKDFTRIVFEVDHIAGHAPRAASLDTMKAKLEELIASGHLGKPGGISIVTDETVIPGATNPDRTYSVDEALELANVHRSLTPAVGTVPIQLFYIDGHSDTEEGTILGFAQDHYVIVMFPRSIDAGCDGVGLPLLRESICELGESTVLLHEMGHIMGLVNNGIDMVENHQDEANGAHDTDTDCLMYWSADRATVFQGIANRFMGGNMTISEFDARCKDDLLAAQN